MKNLIIIGGGPAALMLAAHIDTDKYQVTIYDKKKTVGRKFLVAGEGGLNLTFNSSIEELIANYSPSEFMDPVIRKFTNEDLMHWLNSIEVPTFIGSSNRVFPTKDFKPIEVLNQIVSHISSKNIEIQLDTEWEGWSSEGQLIFDGTAANTADIVIFALGGASWKVTGSDGTWSKAFEARGVITAPFNAANCAFEVDWSNNFISSHEGKPLKNIAITYNNSCSKGELVISKFGLEGNAIYALSEKLQHSLQAENSTIIHLDLKPSMNAAQILTKYNSSKLSKTTDILLKDLNIDRTAVAILKHFTTKESFSDPILLSEAIKSLPIPIKSADEIDKAISTLGGITLDEVDENFQIKKIPNTYAIGEMLDWYAPTGGYLLQGCFSMGYALANHLNELDRTK